MIISYFFERHFASESCTCFCTTKEQTCFNLYILRTKCYFVNEQTKSFLLYELGEYSVVFKMIGGKQNIMAVFRMVFEHQANPFITSGGSKMGYLVPLK